MGQGRGWKLNVKVVAALVALALAATVPSACGDDQDGTTAAAGDNSTETTTEASAGEEAEKAQGGTRQASGGTTRELFFEAHPYGDLSFVRNRTATKAGTVRLQLDNPSKVPHNLAIEDSSGKTLVRTDTVTETSTFATIQLKPGQYTFYCSVPGHREAGMEGTLAVR